MSVLSERCFRKFTFVLAFLTLREVIVIAFLVCVLLHGKSGSPQGSALAFAFFFFVSSLGSCPMIGLVIVDWIGAEISLCKSYPDWADTLLPFDG